MSQTITINSINYSGETAEIIFTPDSNDITINLGYHILPYTFNPELLVPPMEVYGTYNIIVLINGVECSTITYVIRPTPTPTPSPTMTRTPTPTPTPTITPTQSPNPCLVTPTPSST